MRHLRGLGIPLLLTVWYFASIYFTVAALYPRLAPHAAFIAALLAILGYLALVLTDRNTDFLVALLFALPISCVATGVIWWVLRFLELFVIR